MTQFNISRLYIFLPILLTVLTSSLHAQDAKGVAVVVKENQTIREISKQYLGNPDLWEDILRANNLASVAEVKPGLTLRIPVQAITDANKAMEKSQQVIQDATKAGGRIFAVDEINKAIALRDQATAKRKAGLWAECAALAKSSYDEGKKSLDIANKNRNVAADAAVAFRKGDVEKKKSTQNSWDDAPLHSVLLEQDRVRTLNQSYAEIQFRDDSRLRLNENSQALIKKMRANLVDNTGEASVTLEQGDVMALLSGGRGEGSFKLDMPDIDTKVNSQRFWASRKDEAARFANYNGELEVAAAGSKVTIKENQGSVVPKGKAPTQPHDLLTAPELTAPPSEAEIFDASVNLTWSAVPGADKYLVEFATESGFTRLETSQPSKETKLVLPNGVGDGLHYWRVTGVGKDGLPGKPSSSRIIRLITDKSPPFLNLANPSEGATILENPIVVSGSAESGVNLGIISGVPGASPQSPVSIDISSDGGYFYTWNLIPGANKLTIRAVDRAGNETKIDRNVTYLAGEELPIVVTPNLPKTASSDYVTAASLFNVTGQTAPKREVKALATAAHQTFSAWSDDQGKFQFNLRLALPAEEYTFSVTSQTGSTAKASFAVTLDSEPPVITLGDIPQKTASMNLPITGEISGGIELTRGETKIILSVGKFTDSAPLKSGENVLRYSAKDEAGNISTEERTIFCDPDAPKLIKQSVSPSTPKGGDAVIVQVWAQDASQLKQTAPFKLQIGEFVYEDYLSLSDAGSGLFTATVVAPFDVKGSAKLISVTLSDQLGNSQEYNPSGR